MEFFRIIAQDETLVENYRVVLEDSKGVVQLESVSPFFSRLRSQGASKFKILFDPIQIDNKLAYLDLFFSKKKLWPGEEKKIMYQLAVDEGNLGFVQFYSTKDSGLDVQKIFTRVKDVTQTIDRVTGKQHLPYSIFIMPAPISHLLGGEGNFYLGEGKITMNYGEVLTVDCIGMCAVLRMIENEISHEYTHAIQSERGPQKWPDPKLPTDSCFYEGMADALTVYLGYNEQQKLLEATTYAEGCPKSIMQINNMPHNFGRCLFGHLMQENAFSEDFFKRLFNPEMKYLFEDACDVSLAQTCQKYLELFNWASGRDLTRVLKENIKGNCK